MATQTRTTTRPAQTAQPAVSKGAVAVIAPPRLAMPTEFGKEYDLTDGKWRALIDSVFPAAKSLEAIGMALAYCKTRNLDVFKRPVHVVPIWSTAHGRMIETVWPGINELRTTAMRTKNFAGMDQPVYGPVVEHEFDGGKLQRRENGQTFYDLDKGITMQFPEWCSITVYRLLQGNRVPFPGPRVYWLETYSRKGRLTDNPNDMWEKRANGQLEKCAEAAALRRAFPEEIGDEHVPEEIGAFHTHAPIDITEHVSATTGDTPPEPQRSNYTSAGDGSPPGDGRQPAETTPPAGGGAVRKQAASEPSGSDAPTAREPEGTSGPDPKKITDVDAEEATREEIARAAGVHPEQDKSTLDDNGDVDESEPIIFEQYSRVGDFFIFADDWLDDQRRTEAEVVAFGAFYKDYMSERLDVAFKSKGVHEAMKDTYQRYQAALKRTAARR